VADGARREARTIPQGRVSKGAGDCAALIAVTAVRKKDGGTSGNRAGDRGASDARLPCHADALRDGRGRIGTAAPIRDGEQRRPCFPA